MYSYPTIEELFKAIIKDCYDYLFTHTEDKAKESIIKLIDYNKNKDEIIQKSYVVLCSIKYEKPSEGELSSIYDFTKIFFEAIDYDLNDENRKIDRISTINDCCNGYIALFGYIYIFKGVFTNEFFRFLAQYYKYFEEILVKYNVSKDVKEYYEDTVNKLYKTEIIEINNEIFNEFIKYFEKESFEYQKVAKEGKENESIDSPKILKDELKKEDISENGNKSTQLETCDTSNIQNENKSLENGEHISKNKSYNNEDIKLLKKEINDVKLLLLTQMIKRGYDQLNILQNIILKLDFNSVEINNIKKRTEYLNNLIISLKNTVTNLGNPYNFNLWRKLSNIILKNLFVILYKKNFKFLQHHNKSVLNSLKYYEYIFEGKQLEDFKDKVKKYEEKLKKQNEEILSKGASAADRERNYNIIIVENQVKYTLVVDFLFFLKEKGNKIDHFDEEIIDLILFDDLNIDIKLNENSYGKGMNNSKSEKENIQKGEKSINKGKTLFNSEEIIDMLKNPFKYHKEDINVDKIYSAIYEKIVKIKKDNGYEENNTTFNDLKNNAVHLLEEIQSLVASYEKYFIENKINYQNKNENEILDIDAKEHFQNYIYIKDLKEKISKKIELYDNNINALSDLNTITEKCMKTVESFIEEIKFKKQIKGKNNLITISDLFLEFKNTLKDNIVKGQEYKKYRNIFNEKNIDEFSLDDVYTILNETLNYDNTLFSIIKKDITNFNFFIEVITQFNELKYYVYNNYLDIKI